LLIIPRIYVDRLRKSYPNPNPIDNLRLLTQAMQKASKKIFFEHKHEVDKLVLFQRAVSLNRFMSFNQVDESSLKRMTKGTPLHVLVSLNDDGVTWDTSKLKNYIDIAFKIAGVPDESLVRDLEGWWEPPTPEVPVPKAKTNALKELKLYLPSTRTKVEALREGKDNNPTNDPAKLGPLICDYYGKIWGEASQKSSRSEDMDRYLKDYHRRIDPSLISDITLETVLNAISMAPDTSPGPDGIPFSAFKATACISGPVIL